MILAIVLVLYGWFVSAHAQSADFNVLNGVQAKFEPLKVTWGRIIKTYAERLFWALVAVDFGWTTVTYVIDKNDVTDMLGSLAKKMMTISFFFTLLKMSDTWIPMILDSFSQIGKEAGGVSGQSMTPDGIAAVGFSTALGMFEALNGKGMTEKIALVLPITGLAILCFLAFLFVAAQLLVTLIESYIAIGGGIIMLGFGGSRWTTDMASKYMQYAVATGVKLMVIYLVVGAGQSLFDQAAMIDADNITQSCLQAAGAGLVYAYLAFQIPAIASAMMSGSPSMTAGGMMGAAISAGAALAGAGAAAMAGGAGAAAGVSGAAAGASGLSKALGAGLNSGLDMGKSGGDLAAHAMGEVGKHGMGLARGAVGDAVNSARTSFADRVDSTAGGKIASSIEATRGGSVSGVPAPPPITPAAGGAGASGGPSAAAGGDGQARGSALDGGGGGGQASSPGDAAESSQAGSADGTSAAAAPTSAGTSASASGSSGGPSAPTSGAPSGSSAGGSVGAGGISGSTPAAPPAAGGSDSGAATATDSPSTVATGSSSSPTSAAASTSAAVPGGDGQTASVSGDAPSSPQTGGNADRDPLHRRIQELQGYVPQDAAHAASINIDLKHSAD
ncbi:P-type conjugative transfer protein TrbL [Cupriavidus campinensis]|nr:P-type conjugative transfer protein TrbL [Cupriavidus campinensis]